MAYETALNTGWILLGAALVFFMQAGFAMVETGFTRAKNAGNIIMKNLMDFSLGVPIFWLIGYGIMFAGEGKLCDGGHHCIRSHGRENEVFGILRVFDGDFCVCLSDFGSLDLGRRLARAAGIS